MGDVLKADPATTQRVNVLMPFGLTERQARFLATVMLHSGVFVGRQYAAFAGITHGQKVHDFIEKLLLWRFVIPIELGCQPDEPESSACTINRSTRLSASRMLALT
jgi:hypothetical protein